MAPKTKTPASLAATLRSIALALPDTQEGVACAGTPLEARTFQIRGKAFLFVGAKDARLKLAASLAEALAFARKAPDVCQASANGWVRLTLGAGLPAPAVLAKWLAESHGALAGKPKAAKPGAKRGAVAAKKAVEARPRPSSGTAATPGTRRVSRPQR